MTNVQVAIVAIEIKTGKIRALVGGTDYGKSQFNRATQAMRQPGSAFKPIVYLTALLKGYHYNSVIQDRPVTLTSDEDPRPWTPKNYSGRYRGAVTLKQGLALSLNAATVNLAIQVGIRNVVKTAKLLGIQSRIYPVYPSALGASEMTLLELASAYSTIATGKRVEPECIERIIDKQTTSLQEPTGKTETVIHQAALSDIRTMLEAVVKEGTGRKALSLNRPVYGKTGTTNNNVDALFVGFDDNFAVAVWVGKDNHEPIGKKETGARAALPIWIDFMDRIPNAGIEIAESIPTTIDIQQNPEAESDTALADPSQVHQIMLNFDIFAAHVMREKGGTLKVNLIQEDLDSETVAGYPDLNPGSGIDGETMDKIFEPDFTTKEVGKGTGMGFAIIHGIVRSYGDDISVESELVGKGTTFNVYLPGIEADASLAEASSVRIPKGTEKILFN